jgi:hypothetical protein
MKAKKTVTKRKYTRKLKPELSVNNPFKIIRTQEGQIALLLTAELIYAINNALKKPQKQTRSKDHPLFKLKEKSINFFIAVLDKYGLNKTIPVNNKDLLWLAFNQDISKQNIPPILRILETRKIVEMKYGNKGSKKVAESFTILKDPRNAS